MSQSREAMPGSYDDQQSSSIFFDNSNDELDSILMSNWADGELESMMLDWQFDDQKFVPDSSQIIGDHQVATGTQSLSAGCDDPSLQACQDGMASETKDIAPLSDMFTSCLELEQSFIDPQLFKGSPFWIPNYTVPISPGSMHQLPATTAPFLNGLLNDEMYENNILRMFSSEPPQDLPVPAQKFLNVQQTEPLMMMEEAIHPVEPAAAPDLANPSTIISDQQQGAAGIVQPTRGPRAVLGASIKDGYNWRKYGQKNVKDSNSPRSYYKCTYPHCKVTKKEERSPQGNVTEIVYKGGRHNHPRPNPSSSASSYLKRDAPLNARQQNQNMEFNSTEITRPSSKSGRQVKYLVVALADIDVINDGYRWRKYGSKVVKGNSNPRSYYRCTNSGCKARKLVERSPDDLKKLMTTYEGTHNHGVPGPKNSSTGGSSVRSSALPQANGSLVPRFGCPNLISPPRSLPNLPPSLAPLPTRMRMSVPILPQLSSYSGFRGPLQPAMMTMVMPKLETTIQPPPSKTQRHSCL
ncbi:WRKY transcription factor WRKY24-like [Zingiber officinale]|uniref:WRKY transcription factor WRKY24-like n=1 Tax=Zingiber officinale TaxID=94328 RepID=UPI001C4DCB33|nr:WRKY transcription factor WRKY24-like [Zingiber officinale]